MNTQKLMNTALNSLDAIGYRLDQYGITAKVNRHNLAAFIMLEQKHLEGEWDSIQVRLDRRRAQVESLVRPVLNQVNRFRGVAS
ncbi:hypothetical protein MARLIPOL_09346 [Marinobacter lipolyticus SM19]|uniref:Uncharacterized protein n=1 Tax=Marinobacter lipolyticus SM19 TaxID=1318628 RepID=R8AZT5_9GAMM|nr:hypothetical protein [Marinobacter lipolyticus]EON91817.1 hypothetical protein MARLIPOL_09346 [Marinobacter lipolyticus SM19]